MSYLIKDLPDSEKPRERFIKYGVESLSNVELISILLRTGTKNKSVKDLSIELLNEIPFYDLAHIHYYALKDIKGIGSVKAITLLSAIELGRRVNSRSDSIIHIKNSNDLFYYVKEDMENKLQERFMAVYLNHKACVIEKKILFLGTVNYSMVVSRDVFREAVKCNATAILLVHNHPGGSVHPSLEDIQTTKKLIQIGKILEIPVMEHIIVGNNKYYSFKENMGDIFE